MDFYDKGFNDLKTLNRIGLLKVGLFFATFFLTYSLIVFEMSKTCKVGSKNFALNAFLYTIVPLVFIFGTIIALTTVLPGWKAPFSNTIGFFIVKNVIERKLFKLQNWIKVNESTTRENQDYSTIKAFNNNHNKTFFINELTPTNFEGAINKLSIGNGKNIVFEGETPEGNKFKTEKALYSAVVLKDLISEFIWFLIGGTLAFSTAHVYSLDHHCGDIMTDENIEDYINTSG
tara:strand:- start:540 stop:1235 length:696 start_codon:yes stop_codon:yes gene_type:complete